MNFGDLFGFISFFNEWKKEKIVYTSISAMEKTPIYKNLKEGYDLEWKREARLVELIQNGWEIVTEKSVLEKNKIFMIEKDKLILMRRKKTEN